MNNSFVAHGFCFLKRPVVNGESVNQFWINIWRSGYFTKTRLWQSEKRGNNYYNCLYEYVKKRNEIS